MSRHDSYNPLGFAAVFQSWDPERQAAYEARISFHCQGGPVTREAHEAAVKAAGFRRGRKHFDELRKAVDQPAELKL